MASKPKARTREQQFDALCARLRTQLSSEEIAELPPFEEHNRTVTLVQEHNFATALAHLKKARYLGFDTEAKPTFLKGQKEHATSLIQIVTRTKCFIFFVAAIPQIDQLRSLLEDPAMVKVGIGLKSDRQRLSTEFKMSPQNLIDINEIFSLMGRKNNIGSKQLVAHCLKKNLRKSKKISRSDWSAYPLKESQISYAADDAFSSLDAYLELRRMLRPYHQYLTPRLRELLTFKS
jgi:ribonuclease D